MIEGVPSGVITNSFVLLFIWLVLLALCRVFNGVFCFLILNLIVCSSSVFVLFNFLSFVSFEHRTVVLNLKVCPYQLGVY